MPSHYLTLHRITNNKPIINENWLKMYIVSFKKILSSLGISLGSEIRDKRTRMVCQKFPIFNTISIQWKPSIKLGLYPDLTHDINSNYKSVHLKAYMFCYLCIRFPRGPVVPMNTSSPRQVSSGEPKPMWHLGSSHRWISTQKLNFIGM